MRMWKFRSPLSLACSILWNTCESLEFRVPFAPWVFGCMIGSKLVKKEK